MDTKKFLTQFSYFFNRLTSEPRVGGLHISDSAILYADIAGGLKTAGVRLAPGVISEGKVLDSAQLLAALKQLHASIDVNEKKIIPVAVSLPTSGIYTQSFTTPNVGRERLEESAYLNLQMISPMATDTSYMSWQMMQETPDQFELLGAFAEKKFIDDFRVLLDEAHLSPVAFEFPSLSLSRLVGLMGVGDAHPALLLQISGDGLNFSILRNNGLYFDYFRSWRSIQGDDRQITREHFEEVIVGEIQKVMNFTVSKFKETPQKLFMVAPGFESDVQEFIKNHFGLQVAILKITTWNVAPQWYVAIGAALRTSESSGGGDFVINLAAEQIGSFFYHEQTLNFIKLWRSIVIGVLAIFLILFGGSAYSLGKELENAKRDAAIFTSNPSSSELNTVRQQVGAFNMLVSNVRAVESTIAPWPSFFEKLTKSTNAQNVVIEKIDAPSLNGLITLLAHTNSYEGVLSFKNALAANNNFSNVNLLVSQISARDDGSVGFQLTFNFVPDVPQN